tara:strand:+ start:491 stop:637 length:147 start_codon:yes stop_codon:yes gene_type:complete
MLVKKDFVSILKERIVKLFSLFRSSPKHTPLIPTKPFKAKMPRGKSNL